MVVLGVAFVKIAAHDQPAIALRMLSEIYRQARALWPWHEVTVWRAVLQRKLRSGEADLRRLATRVPLPDVPDVRRLDAVRLRVDLDHPSRGDVEIELASPRGTPSRLTRRVTAALHDASFVPHWYTSLAFLGEASGGDWEVRVTDATARGTLRGLQVCVSGTPSPPASPPPPRANSLRPHLWAGGGTLLLGLVATFLTRRRGQKKNQSPSE